MTSKYRSRRAVRKLAKKSKRNFFITLFLIALLFYLTLNWILPTLVNGIGFIKNTLSPAKKIVVQTPENSSLAPPILNIPFEATNTAQINIKGYGTPDSQVIIYLDDEKIDTIKVLEDGSFEKINLELVLGTNNIYGKSLDEKNQESLPSKNFKIIYDNEKPSLNIAEPEDNKNIVGGDKKIKVSGNTEASIKVFINGSQIIVDNDGNFQSSQNLNEGDNIFNIKAVDVASNSTEVSRKIIYQP